MISEMSFRVNAFVFFSDEGPCLQGVRKEIYKILQNRGAAIYVAISAARAQGSVCRVFVMPTLP